MSEVCGLNNVGDGCNDILKPGPGVSACRLWVTCVFTYRNISSCDTHIPTHDTRENDKISVIPTYWRRVGAKLLNSSRSPGTTHHNYDTGEETLHDSGLTEANCPRVCLLKSIFFEWASLTLDKFSRWMKMKLSLNVRWYQLQQSVDVLDFMLAALMFWPDLVFIPRFLSP